MVRWCFVSMLVLLLISLCLADAYPSPLLRDARSTSIIDCTNDDYVETTTEDDDQEIEDTEYVPERECESNYCAKGSGCKLHWAPLAKRWDPVCTCSEGRTGPRCDEFTHLLTPVKYYSRFSDGRPDPGFWDAHYDKIERVKRAMLNPLLSGVLDLATDAPAEATPEEIIEEYHPDRKCEPAESELCMNKASCMWMTWLQLSKRWEPVCACTKDYLGPRCEELEISDGSITRVQNGNTDGTPVLHA